MNIEFHQEVNRSFVLKTYNIITKIAKFIPYFKWTAGILFVVAFFETIFLGKPDMFTMWGNIIVWIPGLLFAFIGAIFHFLTEFKLREMSNKYHIDQIRVQKLVDEILNRD